MNEGDCPIQFRGLRAAHVASPGGLLKVLHGQTAIKVWKNPNLLACSLPGPVEDAPDNLRPILQNKNKDYFRERPIAVINAKDVNSPEDFSQSGTSCWIKMTTLSIEGLRQAFLDPESRIRLASDRNPEKHSELVAISWEGGFLDGKAIHFNENLNVLIGGRGTGKSTIIESIRYALALDPLGDDARSIHEGIVKHVLRSGTKISLCVRSYHPSSRKYLIERTVPNNPIVRDGDGNILPLKPTDVFPGVEIYGQHEIAELARRPEKLTNLLNRFTESSADIQEEKCALTNQLETTRNEILQKLKELQTIQEGMEALPALEERLKQYQDAGVEHLLDERTAVAKEESLLNLTKNQVVPIKTAIDEVRKALKINTDVIKTGLTQDSPGVLILGELDRIMKDLVERLLTLMSQANAIIKDAEEKILQIESKWNNRKSEVQQRYEKILRDLQKDNIDGEEFIRLKARIEELRQKAETIQKLEKEVEELKSRRRQVITEWEELKRKEFMMLQRAAKKVSRKLANRVRVNVHYAGNREPLIQFLRDNVGGRLSETLEIIQNLENFSVTEFAKACLEGKDELVNKYGIPSNQAERLAAIDWDIFMRMQELELPHTTDIELNVAIGTDDPSWRSLDELSTGQKATAVLLLLFLESEYPLIIDQPEDDLDNRFVTDSIVPRMREEKRRRQFIFSTHNANIPVLGDAELIVALNAAGNEQQGNAEISEEHVGSIDLPTVRTVVEEILEGGKAAFELRRLKYGF